MDEEDFTVMRAQLLIEIAAEAELVSEHLTAGAFAPRVMEVMATVPRHEFVPLELKPFAYLNRPLPIGFDKTISQPFIVALMTELLHLRKDDTILEIGTGLGYQTAILATLGKMVYSLDIIEELTAQAKQRLHRQGYANVEIRVGNGCNGWPAHAPFDKVIVTAAPDLIPPPLINQLKPGGRMVIPAGLPDSQKLLLVTKDAHGMVATREILPVRFSLLEDVAPAERV